MTPESESNVVSRLEYVYEGWDGYNRSLVEAVCGLTREQFAFRSTADMKSVGELAWHIADGRVDWFQRIVPERCQALRARIDARNGAAPETYDGAVVSEWLNETWEMVQATLARWTVHDLSDTYVQPYQGKNYAVSRQWVIWRIMAHDIHHGGQLSELLAMQGIFPVELTLLGGHLTEPPQLP